MARPRWVLAQTRFQSRWAPSEPLAFACWTIQKRQRTRRKRTMGEFSKFLVFRVSKKRFDCCMKLNLAGRIVSNAIKVRRSCQSECEHCLRVTPFYLIYSSIPAPSNRAFFRLGKRSTDILCSSLFRVKLDRTIFTFFRIWHWHCSNFEKHKI